MNDPKVGSRNYGITVFSELGGISQYELILFLEEAVGRGTLRWQHIPCERC